MSSPGLDERVAAAAAGLRAPGAVPPRLAVVLGSGLGELADRVADGATFDTASVPHWPLPTVAGHAGRIVLGTWCGVPVALFAGRTHRYEGRDLGEVGFAVRVAAALGAGTLVLTNAAGGLNPGFAPGDLMLATDHINWIGARGLLTAAETPAGRARPVPRVHDPALGAELRAAASEAGIPLRLGVLIGSLGPAYETAAEVRVARAAGADAVCMSTVHEATLAAHLGLRVACLSCVTNRATGLAGRPHRHEDVTAIAAGTAQRMGALLEAWLSRG